MTLTYYLTDLLVLLLHHLTKARDHPLRRLHTRPLYLVGLAQAVRLQALHRRMIQQALLHRELLRGQTLCATAAHCRLLLLLRHHGLRVLVRA